MFLTIFVVSLCTISSVNSESHEAISYQSYNRYDVPLSYKFTTTHEHDTPKRHINNIQYAPLSLKPKEENKDNIITTETLQDTYDVTKNYNLDRSNLEPRDSQENIYYRPNVGMSYVPGYNYKLRSHMNVENERIYNENHNNENGPSQHLLNYKKPQLEKVPSPLPVVDDVKNFAIPQYAPHEIYRTVESNNNQMNENGNRYIKTLPALENENIQPYIVVKTPRLDLNVARAYRFAQGFNKAPTHLNNLKLQNRSPQNKINDHKTYLHPVQNKHVHILHRVR